MASGAIAISLPFSCILGLLSTMTSTTMGRPFSTFRQHYIPEFYLGYYIDSSKFVLSEEKTCLGLCNCPVCYGGYRGTSFLLTGKEILCVFFFFFENKSPTELWTC